jgi:hypothetical protein
VVGVVNHGLVSGLHAAVGVGVGGDHGDVAGVGDAIEDLVVAELGMGGPLGVLVGAGEVGMDGEAEGEAYFGSELVEAEGHAGDQFVIEEVGVGGGGVGEVGGRGAEVDEVGAEGVGDLGGLVEGPVVSVVEPPMAGECDLHRDLLLVVWDSSMTIVNMPPMTKPAAKVMAR